jgi:ATP-dependent Clp protease adaptor protein ClpS
LGAELVSETKSINTARNIFPMSDFPEPIYHDDLVLEAALPRLKRPPLYRVMLLNDDYTTMEFVVQVLRAIFHHSEEKAAQIMMHVHQKGAGICGIYTREVAESKVEQVRQYAEQNEHPLQCTMEPESSDEDAE